MEVIFMPRLGMTMETGEVVRWLKAVDEPVQANEVVLEVLTDKSNSEVESPISGTLARILAEEGDEIAVGQPLAVIAAAGETVDDAQIEATLAKVQKQSRTTAPPLAAAQSAAAPAPVVQEPAPRASDPSGMQAVRATPRVRKLAQELGVDLASIVPTQADGTITEEDVRRSAQ